jgi:hypothetical protein
MKTILRESLTGRFYAGDAGWVNDASEAVEFDSILSAATLANEKGFTTAEVILKYEHPACELTLPLSVCLSDIASITEHNRSEAPPS